MLLKQKYKVSGTGLACHLWEERKLIPEKVAIHAVQWQNIWQKFSLVIT